MNEDSPLHLGEPDLTYQLDAEHRAQVRAPFDPDAFEHLLQRTIPEVRPFLLEGLFRQRQTPVWSHLSRIHDSVLQALLDEAWQPFWDGHPTEVLEDESMDGYPGRLLALERRRLSDSV
jgi:hypothetical protein